MTLSSLKQLGLNRVAYIKYGDVCSEYRQILNQSSRDGDLGYLARLLELSESISTLLISFGNSGQEFRYNQTRVIVSATSASAGIMRAMKDSIKKAVQTLFLLLRYRPDIIVCGRIDQALIGSFTAAKLLKIPILLSCHHALPFEYSAIHRFRNMIYGQIIKQCDRVICVGPFLKDELTALGVSPQKLIEFLPSFNEIQMAGNSDTIDDTFINRQKNYILFAGRIEKEKGVFDLLHAYVKLTGTDRPLLVYAGDGSASKKLKQTVSKKKLGHRIQILGQVPYAQLGTLIRNSCCVVVPSKAIMNEGICKIAVESLVLGAPAIVPDYGVFPYIVTHEKNGLLYATDSIPELAHAMQTLVDTPKLRDRLASGAQLSGKKFLTPQYNFSQAILCSIEKMRPHQKQPNHKKADH